ncbi:hypothetical protein D0849_05560 [Bordetella avium]|nr:hypothetical protein C0J09_00465 [Bordetella avium]RIQ15007.1 hypothetical protein D0432_02455 [Bordetella avium]RIQ18502.1 hypothetical protein D0850_05385 [Bordetella avium]RIQ35462.1 hypothetical protein D0849_05560 [Bordetella avium]RIQ45740.1 hypothetical protein D0847_00485 [Bordetella avium]
MSVIQALQGRGIPIFGVREWLERAPLTGAVIRHDVDRKPRNALRMAQAEAAAGVSATYYFRVVGSAYDKGIMREVEALGHEVGYHYEDLALTKGDVQAALKSFETNLADLRQAVSVATVAMHGSPMSRHNNLDLWKHADVASFGLSGEAFLTVDYTGTYYFTDTGRSWGAIATNLRDRPPGILVPEEMPQSSKQLIEFIEKTHFEKIALSAHPERWDSSLRGWMVQGMKDQLINCAKIAVNMVR